MNEKISIYIPTYNSDDTIEESINSVINQSKKFDQIIIIDDGSTDNTKNILKKFNNIEIITNTKNLGIGKSRNIGVNACRNDLVASIDSDVVIEKSWLENIVKIFKEKNSVYCCGNLKEKYLKNIYNQWRSKNYKLNWGETDVLNPPFIFTCNTLHYKHVWKKVGGFDEKFTYPGGEDIDYSIRVSKMYGNKNLYSSKSMCLHLCNDSIETLANRVWRYHSFAYKIKKPSLLKLVKISIKQFNFFVKRSILDLFNFKFKFILINFSVFVKFIKFELDYIKKNKV